MKRTKHKIQKAISEYCRDFLQFLRTYCTKSKWIACIAILSTIVLTGFLQISCPIQALTGISCPGCGMTRAYIQALHLHFRNAFLCHPLWWLVPSLPFVWSLYQTKRISRKNYDRFLTVFILLFLIAYFIRILFFQSEYVIADPKHGLIFQMLKKNLFHF